jgi:hypothetical protein
MVDAADLKSASCKGVWVRVPPSALIYVHHSAISGQESAPPDLDSSHPLSTILVVGGLSLVQDEAARP